VAVAYLSVTLYFTDLENGFSGLFTREFWVTLIWTAIYGLPIGYCVFFLCYALIPKTNPFWKSGIAIVFGGLAGWGALFLIFTEFSQTFIYGGFAAIMGAATFLFGMLTHRFSNQVLIYKSEVEQAE
jgi:uncharacterized BrkB/YihY/UPF0761 family membrane protein